MDFERLVQIDEAARDRVEQIAAARKDWPCRKGCDDCCRSLASEPMVTLAEWARVAQAIGELPAEVAEAALRRIRETAGKARPVVCPLLDRESGACLIYEARPVPCRTYGFYAERGKVLGCGRIEVLARGSEQIVWGNQAAVEAELGEIGPIRPFSAWLGRSILP